MVDRDVIKIYLDYIEKKVDLQNRYRDTIFSIFDEVRKNNPNLCTRESKIKFFTYRLSPESELG